MQYTSYIRLSSSYDISHHGIKGMHWGIRRYQNEDGTLTEAGKKHYGKQFKRELKSANIKLQKSEDALKNISSYDEKRAEALIKVDDHKTKFYEADARKQGAIYDKNVAQDLVDYYQKEVDDKESRGKMHFTASRKLKKSTNQLNEATSNIAKADKDVQNERLLINKYMNESLQFEAEITKAQNESARYKKMYNSRMEKIEKRNYSLEEAKAAVDNWRKTYSDPSMNVDSNARSKYEIWNRENNGKKK